MADIESGGGGKHKGGKVRGNKKSTRVDFTPMVDLGFLLITFFMLTTTMSKPTVMEINMPLKDNTIKEEDQNKLKASQAMTIMLTGKDQVLYYMGLDKDKSVVTDYSAKGIREVLLRESRMRNPNLDSIPVYEQMARVKKITQEEYNEHAVRLKSQKQNLWVVIKADDKSRYNNLVDILDEMLICNIGSYAIVDIAPEDEQLIDNHPQVKR